MNVVQGLPNGKIWLGQSSYTKFVLQQFGMTDAKAVKTPLIPSMKLSKATDSSKAVNIKKYQSAVEKLLYIATRT